MPVIGYLCPESPELFASRLKAFHEGLAESGYVEGRNVAIEYRWAEWTIQPAPGRLARIWPPERWPCSSLPEALPSRWPRKPRLRQHDRVRDGRRPCPAQGSGQPFPAGRKHHGSFEPERGSVRKRLEFIKELVPAATAFGVVVNPTSPTAHSQMESLNAAADDPGCSA